MSRANELIRTTPVGVLFIVALCSLTFCWQNLASERAEYNFTMNPQAIIFQHQFYRIVTSSFLHGSMFHIAANMMAFLTMGTHLERTFGTLWHLTTILWSVVLVSCAELLMAVFAMYVCGWTGWMDGHSLGFSGTLFHLLVIQCKINPSMDQSVFGLFRVSSKTYPYASLVAIQLILPNVSFLGHLCGIIVGEIHTMGYLNCILPSAQRLRLLDESTLTRRIISSGRENYVKTPFSDDIFNTSFARRESSPSSLSSRRTAVVRFLSTGCNFVKDAVLSLKVMIFGRGDVNENIRLSETEISTLLVGIGDSQHGDGEGEWDGLETIPLSDQNESQFI